MYERIISVENLLEAWHEFICGKRHKEDVQEFKHRLMDNILSLHRDLAAGSYQHGGYHAFKICDPKPRDISKAGVRDRLLHHAVYRVLYPLFDKTWISDSYSCRLYKGTHRAGKRFRAYAYKVSRNHRRTCWVLQCDIRKFFANIDQAILMRIVRQRIEDERVCSLIQEIVGSFSSTGPTKGLPLGNLTSQLLVNVYMNEFDQYIKHKLKCRYYLRYADDFVILSNDRLELERLIPHIAEFLATKLNLSMHPKKVRILTIAAGVDFLGWVYFKDHKVLRPVTKRRMLRTLAKKDSEASRISYLGLLSHGNTRKLLELVENRLGNQT